MTTYHINFEYVKREGSEPVGEGHYIGHTPTAALDFFNTLAKGHEKGLYQPLEESISIVADNEQTGNTALSIDDLVQLVGMGA